MFAMPRLIFFTLLLLSLLPSALHSAWQQDPTPTASPDIAILSPLPGQALQGGVQIAGNTAVDGFQSTELAFSYVDDTTGSWFLIAQSAEPVANSLLAQWDTTTITDGVYTLRLVVTLANGSQRTVTVPGVRVRNYSAIETDTPTPVTPTATSQPGEAPTATPAPAPTLTPIPPTATPLPPNPAQLSPQAVLVGMGQGILVILGLFALIGLYTTIRALILRKP